jgi:prevent-host-death family protein
MNYLAETYMVEVIVTAIEMKNDFDKYLDMVIRGNEVIVTENGKELGRFIPKSRSISYLTDSLTGIIKGEYDLKKEKARMLDLNMPATHCGK